MVRAPERLSVGRGPQPCAGAGRHAVRRLRRRRGPLPGGLLGLQAGSSSKASGDGAPRRRTRSRPPVVEFGRIAVRRLRRPSTFESQGPTVFEDLRSALLKDGRRSWHVPDRLSRPRRCRSAGRAPRRRCRRPARRAPPPSPPRARGRPGRPRSSSSSTSSTVRACDRSWRSVPREAAAAQVPAVELAQERDAAVLAELAHGLADEAHELRRDLVRASARRRRGRPARPAATGCPAPRGRP